MESKKDCRYPITEQRFLSKLMPQDANHFIQAELKAR